MTNHARNGAARERRVIKLMEAHGWMLIMRSAASKGPADFCALHPFLGLAFVQVGTANKEFRCSVRACEHEGYESGADHARAVFVAIAEQTHALPLLATSGPGIPTRFFRVTRDTASTWTEFPIAPDDQPIPYVPTEQP